MGGQRMGAMRLTRFRPPPRTMKTYVQARVGRRRSPVAYVYGGVWDHSPLEPVFAPRSTLRKPVVHRGVPAHRLWPNISPIVIPGSLSVLSSSDDPSWKKNRCGPTSGPEARVRQVWMTLCVTVLLSAVHHLGAIGVRMWRSNTRMARR